MGKTMKRLGTIALAAVVGFSITACSNNPAGGGGGGGGGGQSLVAGSFSSPNGNNAKFYADAVGGSLSKTASGLSQNEVELAGKIEDGDIIFNLKGVFNSQENKFYLSAGSSFLVYQIAGAVNNGVMTNTQATVKVKSGDDWTAHTVAVTAASDDVSIDGNASNDQADGIPSAWFGKWLFINEYDEGDEDGRPEIYTMTAWQFVNDEYPDEPAGFLDIAPLGNGKLEMIWEMYVYDYYDEGGGDYDGDYGDKDSDLGEKLRKLTKKIKLAKKADIINDRIEFIKIWIEGSGQELLITAFMDSLSENYAETKVYNTATADEESKNLITLTRP